MSLERISCSMPGCNDSNMRHFFGKRYFRFSNDDLEHRRSWIEALNLKNPDGSSWIPKENTIICYDHFNLVEPKLESLKPVDLRPLLGNHNCAGIVLNNNNDLVIRKEVKKEAFPLIILPEVTVRTRVLML